MTTGTEWREVDGATAAWFDAPSLIEGAALAEQVIALSVEAVVDVRPTGVRVRLGSNQHAGSVSAAARRLGLVANPGVLQQLGIVFDSANPDVVRQFWQRVLDGAAGREGEVRDPLRRDPAIQIRPSTETRRLRNRIHADVVRPAAAVDEVGLGEAFGPYGVCHSDPDGNEVDLVPGDPLSDLPGTSDWQAVFSAMACYRTTTVAQQGELVTTAAALAVDAGFPLLIDVRPGLVVLDSGKDQWEGSAHGLELDFARFAGRLQTAARDIGVAADPTLPRFVQLVVDAADIDAVSAFWVAVLGYVRDRRHGVTDIVDPRRLNPVLVFQNLDAADAGRHRQRNRIHLELAVPSDIARARLVTAVAAGGRVVDEHQGRWVVADPEGNELVVVSAPSTMAG